MYKRDRSEITYLVYADDQSALEKDQPSNSQPLSSKVHHRDKAACITPKSQVKVVEIIRRSSIFEIFTMETQNVHHEDLVPGTVHLVHQGAHSGTAKHDIVLVPIPSSDPTDPLVRLYH